MFQQPSQGDRIDISAIVGSLVLIHVRELREGIPTPYGEKEALVVDLHALDGPKGGEVFSNALIFQGALIGSLRSAIGGEPVLARIGQGVAKPGQSAPYILSPFTDADAALATGYMQRQAKPFQQAEQGPTGAAGTSPAAATPSPAAASPASANPGVTAVDLSKLPPEVLALLQQQGAA